MFNKARFFETLREFARGKKQRLKDGLNDFCDAVAVLGARRASNPSVLIVRFHLVGDFMLWLPCAQALREHYAGRKIVLLTGSPLEALSKALPFWDEVWPVDYGRLAKPGPYRWRMWRRLRKAGFSVALNPTLSRVYAMEDSAVKASGAPERIGSSGDLSNCTSGQKSRSDLWYTRLLPANPEPRDDPGPRMERHESGHNAEFLLNLTGMKAPDRARIPAMPCRAGFQIPDGPYFLVAPGANWSGRRWPVHEFSEVADNLSTAKGWRGVLCGGDADGDYSGAVARACRREVEDRTGQTTLPELVELIRGSVLVIGNESGPVHIACAVGTPAVCVTGGGHFGRFVPYPGTQTARPTAVFEPMECYHCNWRCVKAHDEGGAVPCVSAVTVERVLEAVEQALNAAPSGTRPGGTASRAAV